MELSHARGKPRPLHLNMPSNKIDYSLYLVTDSTTPVLKGRHLPTIVQEAIRGGSHIKIIPLTDFAKKA